jgi:hypothetical protein
MIAQAISVERYTCPVCHDTYERQNPKTIQCLVIHSPGSCCHYGEKKISD